MSGKNWRVLFIIVSTVLTMIFMSLLFKLAVIWIIIEILAFSIAVAQLNQPVAIAVLPSLAAQTIMICINNYNILYYCFASVMFGVILAGILLVKEANSICDYF